MVGLLGGFLVAFLIALLFTGLSSEGAGSVARTIFNPSGKSTPARREYSYAESLAARGHHEKAINAYQACCTDYPDDPEPLIRIARLYRDHLDMYDDALFWFKRARSGPALNTGRELPITHEIIELYTHKIGDPQKAIPELARLVDRFPDDPVSAWAKQEIARLRQGDRLGE